MKKRLTDLIGKMTLDEKIGQLVQCGTSIYSDNLDMNEELLAKLKAGKIGSFLSLSGPEKLNKLQRIVMEETRLKIPLFFGHDIIHGYRTVFPVPIAEACSFEPEIAKKTCRQTAAEARANGIHMTWAPMVDVSRDQRWGRSFEGCGEDVCLGTEFAKARVEGFQGGGIDKDDSLAACVKHFACYGAIEGGRDYNTVDMSRSKMYNVYFPTYRAAIAAGAQGVMTAFNEVDGVPCVINKWLLKDILRDEMGFDGLVISDANALGETVTHGAAEDKLDACVKALKAGMDIEMMSDCYESNIETALKSGRADMADIDRAVYSVLDLKDKLSLFENPYIDEEKAAAALCSTEARELAREAAKRCVVLLENNGALPMKPQKIAVIGKIAEDRESTIGGWVAAERKANLADCVTILDAVREEYGEENVIYAPGYDFVDTSLQQTEMYKNGDYNYMFTNDSMLAAAEDAAKDADMVLFVAGESQVISGESESRAELTLPARQEELLERLKACGKKVVTLVVSGRPLVLGKAAELSDALLFTYALGSEMGHAVCDVLSGRYNPSAKIAFSMPSHTAQCPTMYYSQMNTGRPAPQHDWWCSRYIDAPFFPQYCFGYGKSYTEFEFSGFTLDKSGYAFGDKIEISVTVKNIGDTDGEEVIQIYTHDVAASMVRPVREMKLFRKVFVPAGGQVTEKFELDTSELGFYDNNTEYLKEPGKFEIYAGGCVCDCLKKEIYIK